MGGARRPLPQELQLAGTTALSTGVGLLPRDCAGGERFAGVPWAQAEPVVHTAATRVATANHQACRPRGVAKGQPLMLVLLFHQSGLPGRPGIGNEAEATAGAQPFAGQTPVTVHGMSFSAEI